MSGFASDEGFERRPLTLRFADPTSNTEAYGFTGSVGMTLLEGQLLTIPRATHFYQSQPNELTAALDALNAWRWERNL